MLWCWSPGLCWWSAGEGNSEEGRWHVRRHPERRGGFASKAAIYRRMKLSRGVYQGISLIKLRDVSGEQPIKCHRGLAGCCRSGTNARSSRVQGAVPGCSGTQTRFGLVMEARKREVTWGRSPQMNDDQFRPRGCRSLRAITAAALADRYPAGCARWPCAPRLNLKLRHVSFGRTPRYATTARNKAWKTDSETLLGEGGLTSLPNYVSRRAGRQASARLQPPSHSDKSSS